MANENKALMPYVPPKKDIQLSDTAWQPQSYPQPIIIQGGGGSSKGGVGSTVIKTVVVVGGVILAGGLIYLIYKAAIGGGTKSSDVDLSVDVLQDTVASGDFVRVNATLTNVSKATISPKLRFDLKHGTGGTTTVNENPVWVAYGSMAPGDSVTRELSMTVPNNWPAGTEIYGRIILYGTEGAIWDEFVAAVSGTLSQTYLTIQSQGVDDLTNKCVPYGGSFEYNIHCSNASSEPIPCTFVIGFRDQSPTGTYSEAVARINVPPGDSIQKIRSLAANFYGSVLDIRVLVAQGANIIVGGGLGSVTTGGLQTTKIFEGDACAYAGDSKFQFIEELSLSSMISYYPIAEPSTRIPANGKITNGSLIGVNFKVTHIGPTIPIKCGVFLKTDVGPTQLVNGWKGFWIQIIANVPETAVWQDWEIVGVTGPANITGVPAGREISCYAAICKTDQMLEKLKTSLDDKTETSAFTPAVGLSFWT